VALFSNANPQDLDLEGLDPTFIIRPGEEGRATDPEADHRAQARKSVIEAEAAALLQLLGNQSFKIEGNEDAVLARLEEERGPSGRGPGEEAANLAADAEDSAASIAGDVEHRAPQADADVKRGSW
jgi:hypothetical protein